MSQIINTGGNLGVLKSKVALYILVDVNGKDPITGIQVVNAANLGDLRSRVGLKIAISENGNSF